MQQRKEVIIMALRYIGAILLLLASDVIYKVIQPLTFYASYIINSLFTKTAIASGTLLEVSGQVLEFVPACAALAAYLLLFVLILLTKGISYRKGIKLALLGSLMIFIANIVRIELLIYILLNLGTNLFDTLHLFIWKVLSSIFVALVWIWLVLKYKIKSVPIISDIKALFK